mmetsp:Transcript_20884/g.32249  ORF Transcript_20884/g.32249 Transcript_20884/m.32249 type:complete len:164 (+) Transcript_20884:1816-2307(+)
MRTYIKEYYSSRISSDISVALTKYDQDNTLIDDALTEDEVMLTATSVTFQYEVEVLKLRDGSSVSQIYVDGSGVDILLPVDHVMSLPPNKGYMRIKCVDEYGNEDYSHNFHYSWNSAAIEARIMWGCPYLSNNVQVRSVNTFNYTENGRELWISFQGYSGDLG